MSRSLRELYESSPFSSAQAPYVEEQYERFLADPASVSQEWRDFFGRSAAGARRRARLPRARRPPRSGRRRRPLRTRFPTTDVEKQSSVSRLIQFYANRGHLIADIDPLGLMQRPMPHVLDPDLCRAQRVRHEHGVSHREPDQRRRQADEAVGAPEAAAAHLYRTHRRGVRARFDERRAPMASGPLPGRAAPSPLHATTSD